MGYFCREEDMLAMRKQDTDQTMLSFELSFQRISNSCKSNRGIEELAGDREKQINRLGNI